MIVWFNGFITMENPMDEASTELAANALASENTKYHSDADFVCPSDVGPYSQIIGEGDVHIKGNLCEGAIVAAKGKLKVDGYIEPGAQAIGKEVQATGGHYSQIPIVRLDNILDDARHLEDEFADALRKALAIQVEYKDPSLRQPKLLPPPPAAAPKNTYSDEVLIRDEAMKHASLGALHL